MIEKEQDVAGGMQLLRESRGVLSIQQLIPFFPEFTTIDDFKIPLCTSLREHSVRIQASRVPFYHKVT